MGPWTRAIRIVFSGLFGLLAGFVVSLVINAVLYEVASWFSGERPQLQMAIEYTVGLMVLGAVIGALVGAARAKTQYHDLS